MRDTGHLARTPTAAAGEDGATAPTTTPYTDDAKVTPPLSSKGGVFAKRKSTFFGIAGSLFSDRRQRGQAKCDCARRWTRAYRPRQVVQNECPHAVA